MEIVKAIQCGIMLAGIAFLVALAACLCGRKMAHLIQRIARGIGMFASLALVVSLVYIGSTKSIRYDTGLTGGAGTYVTNDTVHIEWTYTGIPSAATVYVDIRECGSTGEWANLGDAPITALHFDGTLANATNYDYYVYAYYEPPTPVHTNGVWVGQAYETKAHRGAEQFIIINGSIKRDGATIAPPVLKRKEEDE